MGENVGVRPTFRVLDQRGVLVGCVKGIANGMDVVVVPRAPDGCRRFSDHSREVRASTFCPVEMVPNSKVEREKMEREKEVDLEERDAES